MATYFPFESWPYTWIFLANRIAKDVPSQISLDVWVDADWSPSDKPSIAEYLKSAPIFMFPLGPDLACGFCGKSLDAPGMWRWDGHWLWQHELLHLIEEHSTRLPDSFLKRIRNAHYAPPNRDAVDYKVAETMYVSMMEVVNSWIAEMQS